jgi:hypothetical protein
MKWLIYAKTAWLQQHNSLVHLIQHPACSQKHNCFRVFNSTYYTLSKHNLNTTQKLVINTMKIITNVHYVLCDIYIATEMDRHADVYHYTSIIMKEWGTYTAMCKGWHNNSSTNKQNYNQAGMLHCKITDTCLMASL